MAIPSIMRIGHSGMSAAKAGIATTGHNISNTNTEGYSRQRVMTEASEPVSGTSRNGTFGTGTRVSRVERVNDEYIDKQIRNGQKDLSHYEEKDLALKQVEDIFNELNGDGLNRFISRFFNEFRKLSNEPENTAIRQSVREASQAVVNDFHRLRKAVTEVQNHLDQRIQGFVTEVNVLSKDIVGLNARIRSMELVGGNPNDLLDTRDLSLRKLGTLLDISMHKDRVGSFNVDIKGVGPLISSVQYEELSVETSPANEQGKPEGAYDIRTTGSAHGIITNRIEGGKLGGLLEIRDRMVSTVLDRLDDMAFSLTQAVNDIHTQGVGSNGMSGIHFFDPLGSRSRASEFIALSDEVQDSVNNIVTALDHDSPGDNRIALGIAALQGQKVMNEGNSNLDDWYNSIVSDVGVATARNRFSMNQQRDVVTQLNKIREQISGVSIDEETTNLMQYQHAFDASAKVIQVADEMLKTVLAIKRD